MELSQSIEDAWLEPLEQHAICSFDLPVCGRVSDCSPVDFDVIVVAKFQEFPAGELRSVVRDYGVRHSESVDDVEEELHRLLGLDSRNGAGLNPLGKFVDCDKHVCVAPGRFSEGSDQIQSPDREGPRDGDGLEGLRREMGLPGIVLTPLARSNDARCIGDRRRPVKALPEGVAHQRS